MNRETDTVLLQTIGRFIAAQVQLAVGPLTFIIESQAKEIKLLKDAAALVPVPVNGKDGTNGKDCDMAEVMAAVTARVDEYLERIPVPQNGKDGIDGKNGVDGKDGAPGADGKDGANGKDGLSGGDGLPGKDGKDADMVQLLSYIDEAIKTIPIPSNGRDGNDGKDGKDGINGKDGADVVAAFRDSDKHLILTLSNGVTKDIGPIHGQDGKDGKDGVSGKDGVNGRDGFSLDNFEMLFDGERTYTYKFASGELKKEFKFINKNLLYRGIWRAGVFQCGDVVTYDGSMFVATQDTDTVPGTPNSGWQLATKRGRDGKDGVKGKEGPPGKDGRPGRDLTQMAPDGRKW